MAVPIRYVQDITKSLSRIQRKDALLELCSPQHEHVVSCDTSLE